jgi:hypothetical protein
MSTDSNDPGYALKTIGDKRYPIPNDGIERFMATVWSIAGMSGADKVPSILKKIEELNDAITEHLTGKAISAGNGDADSQKKRFLAVFKGRYLENTGHEYPNLITGKDSKIIKAVIDKLNANGFCVDTYLKWLFDDYALSNRAFNPAQMGWVCSNIVVAKFLSDNRGIVDHARLQMLVKEREETLRMRCRSIIAFKESIPVEEIELFKVKMKAFGSDQIEIAELERLAAEIEKKYNLV